MVLLLRHLFDPLADDLARRLDGRARSLVIEQWLGCCRIEHRVGGRGAATAIHRHDGLPLLDDAVTAIVNRVRHVPVPGYRTAAAADRDYAAAEATALLWSCIEAARCPVLNGARALGMVGRAASPLPLAAQAHAAGLATLRYRLTTRLREAARTAPGVPQVERVAAPFDAAAIPVHGPAWHAGPACIRAGELWIVGDRVAGSLDGVAPAAALAFARRIGMGFGVLRFGAGADGVWRWCDADCLPPVAPPAVLAALVEVLAPCVPAQAPAEAP